MLQRGHGKLKVGRGRSRSMLQFLQIVTAYHKRGERCEYEMGDTGLDNAWDEVNGKRRIATHKHMRLTGGQPDKNFCREINKMGGGSNMEVAELDFSPGAPLERSLGRPSIFRVPWFVKA